MPDAPAALDALLSELATEQPFLERACAAADAPRAPLFRAAYASIARRLGERGRSQAGAPTEIARAHWTLVDGVRAALLSRAIRADNGGAAALVATLFSGGELGEQESLLRTLAILPGPERFVDTAVLACRTNARRVFEAIACENYYPMAYFPAASFEAMVEKALFVEVSLGRIDGLAARTTPEISRRLRDYSSERRATGRSVPAEVDALLAPGGPGAAGSHE